MSSIGTGYDQSTTTFSPQGKVFQVEYAMKAVDNSSSAIGLRCKDGVVLAVEKLVLSKMMVEGSNRRIFSADRHVGMAVSGLMADARQVVNRARAECEAYSGFYGDLIPGNILCDRVSGFMHMFTLYWSVRPFGSSVLIATYDQDGPGLYAVEPSGLSYKFFGAAIGKGRNTAKPQLEKLKLSEMTCREALVEAAKIIYDVHYDVKDTDFELEMSWICDESGRQHTLVPEELKAEAERLAKAAMEADMDDD